MTKNEITTSTTNNNNNKTIIDKNRIEFPEPKTDHQAYKVEEKHVHQIYDIIASHFDSTRYKAWPIVEKFLLELPMGSIGIDVGCGNGKYLSLGNGRIYTIGSDICKNFTQICNEKGFQSLVADNLYLPYQSNSFDHAISIAVIHHFSTFQRRLDALKEIIRVLKPGGTLLVTAWAITQKWKGKQYENQDVMVPWLFQNQFTISDKNEEKNTTTTTTNSSTNDNNNENLKQIHKAGQSYEVYQRYYHLFDDGEFESLFKEIPQVEIISNDLDHDNYYCFVKKK
eukprot:gene3752-4672_t